MRLAWWVFIVIGLALLGVGAFTTLTSQNTMDYCRSLIKTLSCGGSVLGTAQPKFFLSEASTVSLQEAELTWAIGFVLMGLGLVSMAYGVFSKVKPEKTQLAAT